MSREIKCRVQQPKPTVRPCVRRVEEQDELLGQPLPGGIPVDMDLAALLAAVESADGELYAYVVDTIENDGGHYRQTGNSPNWQGDLIPLCDCKHWMRTTRPSVQSWVSTWVAGFTGINEFTRGNHLVYLMRVGAARSSQRRLWQFLPDVTRQAKSARHDVFGDLYEPRQPGGDPLHPERDYDPAHYFGPTGGHVHEGLNEEGDIMWHIDINYPGSKKPALVVGEAGRSFVWSEPAFSCPQELGRGHRRFTSALEFLSDLVLPD